jgi:hypothetical protein
MLIVVLLVGGCGEARHDVTPVTTRVITTVRTPAAVPAIKRLSPREPVPTRLVAGPVLFRISGAPRPTRHQSTPQSLYNMIFRLNREPIYHGDIEELPFDTPVGDYSIIDQSIGWNFENSIFAFGKTVGEHCFVGAFDTEDVPAAIRRLRLGERVRVELQPTTPAGHRKLKLGSKVYVRYPRLLSADYYVHSRRALAALKRIGCSPTHSNSLAASRRSTS